MDFNGLLQTARQADGISVSSDSRMIKAGDIFVAVQGTKVDGHDYVDQAIKNGAKYIVAQRKIETGSALLVIVESSQKALGILAQEIVGRPAQNLTNLAVTGTNGKTTTCYIVRSIVNAANSKCGLIGTIAYDNASGKGLMQSDMTTPDSVRLADMTREMVDNGAEFMAIEASSHALEQDRLAGMDFHAAAFTNLTGDHLDYHQTMENYLKAKARLFENLYGGSFAVLNADAPQSKTLAELTDANILYYGIDENAGAAACDASVSDIHAQILEITSSGSVYQLCYNDQSLEVRTNLPGKHNISNQLAAAGLCLAAGFNLEQVARGIETLDCVPGRLQRVDCGQDFEVLVDYAHTDDALKNVLSTLKPICKGKLIVVFGCGGDRDRTKRPRMAKVAQENSDIAILTSDNPRTEDPQLIIDDVIAGFARPDDVIVEPDRKAAIAKAIEIAQMQDIILIAGKGHEDYQIIGTVKTHFDDCEVAREFLKNK